MADANVLLVGEICVDFTSAAQESPVKMRLGGVVHAARGLWAVDTSYAVGAFCPEYLAESAERYLQEHGCIEFIRLGNIVGAPNVFVIGDAREVGHQGYEDILRDERETIWIPPGERLRHYERVIIFPGSFHLADVAMHLGPHASAVVDIAYGVDDIQDLDAFHTPVFAIALSTSSALFQEIGADDVSPLLSACKEIGSGYLLLKENRGGSRLFDLRTGSVEYIPAVLGKTVNSVGVGDVYTAVFGSLDVNPNEAAWRGMQVATRYAETTFPDDFKTDVQREVALSLEEVRGLGGVSLPWHDRKKFDIYLAAPDFSYIDKPEIENAIKSLEYHNFSVRRPVLENGQAQQGDTSALRPYYYKDIELLNKCSLVFAVPLSRDPGTLVEAGMAITLNKPLVTFDPRHENANTMVICGSNTYSDDLDECLSCVFSNLSKKRY